MGAPPLFLYCFAIGSFQSTLSHGSDSVHASDNVALCYFNPRSLVGATRSWSANLSRRSYFNPRSLAGATALNISSACLHRLFQSTLPYGSDRYPRRKHCGAGYFNPRSLTGATQIAEAMSYSWAFQSTLPQGSDIHGRAGEGRGRNFNPRSLTGATGKGSTL